MSPPPLIPPRKVGKPLKYTDEVLSVLAKSLKKWVDGLAKKKELGLLGDWCFDNEFNPRYFSRYTKKHEEFAEAYDLAKAWQEHAIAKGALKNDLNPLFARFFLGCCHNWRTKDATEDKLSRLANSFDQYLKHVKPEEYGDEEDEEC